MSTASLREFAGSTVLVADDEEPIRRLVATLLESAGIKVLQAANGDEALARASQADAIVLDNMMPERDGQSVLRALPRPIKPVVFLTADPSVENAVGAMVVGAVDYLLKPLRIPPFVTAVERALRLARQPEAAERSRPPAVSSGEIVGDSKTLRHAVTLAERAAATGVPVLLLGESGTGKELFARHIHESSRRASGPFIAVNCAALPRDLVESELFGHERGAFTGAVGKRDGLFVQADGGTLFFDEVGELDPSAQAKLLRALQTAEITPVGGKTRTVDVRVVAATHRALRGPGVSFREDLYFRLAVFELQLPPLRDRLDDVPLLAERILAKFAKQEGRAAWKLAASTVSALTAYDWPGNVRELSNALIRAAILSDGEIRPDVLPTSVREGALLGRTSGDLRHDPVRAPEVDPIPGGGEVLALTEQERLAMERALRETGGNITKAAELLGIGRATFYRKARRYGLTLRAGDESETGDAS